MKFSAAALFPIFLIVFSVESQNVHYVVTVDPPKDRFLVSMALPPSSQEVTTFFMPAWAPGNYKILNFGRWLTEFKAWDKEGQLLPSSRIGINEWRISGADRLASVSYSITDIPEDSVESLPTSLNDIDSIVAFFNGPSLFGYIRGREDLPHSVRYELPHGWKLWTALSADTAYHAPTYHELIDAPVLAGDGHISTSSFQVDGKSYTFVVSSERRIPQDSLIAVTEPVVRYQSQLFQGVPFADYLFLLRLSNQGSRFGALEHAASSAYYLPIPVSRRDIRVSFYSRVIAHELFHAWLPKRIHPEAIARPNYQDSLRIRTMWFIEGFTEYYAKLSLVRSGVLPPEYLFHEIRNLALDQSSDNLVTLSLQSGEHGVAAPMYTKGALIGLITDIEIRQKSKNKKSLDDVMLYLWREDQRVYRDDDFDNIVKRATGVNIKGIVQNYVTGRKSPPIQNYLTQAGMNYEFHYRPFFGWSFDIDEENRLYLTAVTKGSTTEALGLEVGDVVVEVQGRRLATDLDSIRAVLRTLESMQPGDQLRLLISRSGSTKSLQGAVRPAQAPEIRVVENARASAAERAILNGILGRRQ